MEELVITGIIPLFGMIARKLFVIIIKKSRWVPGSCSKERNKPRNDRLAATDASVRVIAMLNFRFREIKKPWLT
jgi:hypothetical protein